MKEKKPLSKKMKWTLIILGIFILAGIFGDKKPSDDTEQVQNTETPEYNLLFSSPDYSLAVVEVMDSSTVDAKAISKLACSIAWKYDSNEVQLVATKAGTNYRDGYIGTALCYDGEGDFSIPTESMRQNYISIIGHYFTVNDIVGSFMDAIEMQKNIMPFYENRPLAVPVDVDDIINMNGKWYLKEFTNNPFIKYVLFEYTPKKDRVINKQDKVTINGKFKELGKDYLVFTADYITVK